MATLIHSAPCKSFFQDELLRKEGGEFGKRPRVDGGGHSGGGGGKHRDSAVGTSYSPTSKAFIGSNMLLFDSNFEPLLFYKKRVHNFFMREGVR
jgi:hypothetical protein